MHHGFVRKIYTCIWKMLYRYIFRKYICLYKPKVYICKYGKKKISLLYIYIYTEMCIYIIRLENVLLYIHIYVVRYVRMKSESEKFDSYT